MKNALLIALRAVVVELAADQIRRGAIALRAAGAGKAADYTRRALKSAQGAARHAGARVYSDRISD